MLSKGVRPSAVPARGLVQPVDEESCMPPLATAVEGQEVARGNVGPALARSFMVESGSLSGPRRAKQNIGRVVLPTPVQAGAEFPIGH